jgi:formylglycine-generating enzyme required for sulfatase activity
VLGIVFSTASWLSPILAAIPQDAPPGLVFIKGEKNTSIGSDPKDVEALILANQGRGNVYAGETPKTRAEVHDFYLGATEITNEQYAAFVAATGAKPPYLWGEGALDAGRAAFLEAEHEKKKAARANGEHYQNKTFDAEAWWEKNWQGAKWEVPENRKAHPVVFVTYADVLSYAAWAGLRLMTEFEFSCAARGSSDRLYPWGEEWMDGKYCQSRHGDRDDSLPVASFEQGAVNGIYDLAGNVWEWTSSPYTPFKKYRPLKIKTKSGKRRSELHVEAGFDPNLRVLVSGSFKQTRDGVRIPTRMPTSRDQSAEALGFRVASSRSPSLDLASELIKNTIDFRVLPQDDVNFIEQAALVKQRWTTAAGSVKAAGYKVITGHEKMLYCPVTKIAVSNKKSLENLSINAPIIIGFLSLSKPMADPLLDGGTYLLGWRAAGKLPKLETDEPIPAWSLVDGFQPEVDVYFLYSVDGTPQVAFPSPPVAEQRMRPGTVNLEPYVEPDLSQFDEENPPPPPLDTLRYTFTIPSKKRSKGFWFDLPIKLEPGTVDTSWK